MAKKQPTVILGKDHYIGNSLRKLVLHALRSELCEVRFIKADGTKRIMQCTLLETFLHEKFYDHPAVKDKTTLWRERLKTLFNVYRADPARLPPDHRRRVEVEGEKLERVICDYVAGMTDRYAARQWEELVGHSEPRA